MPAPDQCHITGIVYQVGQEDTATPAVAAYTRIHIVPVGLGGVALSSLGFHVTSDANGLVDFYIAQNAQINIDGRIKGFTGIGATVQVPALSSYAFESLVAITVTPATFGNPMTTAGDLIIGGTGGAATRLAKGSNGQVLTITAGVVGWGSSSGTGTVTDFSAGNLSPLFTSAVATSTSTPALTFALSTQSANRIFAGPASGSAAAPTFRAIVAADLPADGYNGTYQPLNANLTTFAAIAPSANVQTLLGAASFAAFRSSLGLAIGSDVQAFDAELAALAGLTSAADRLPYFTGSGTASLATFTAFGRSLVDDADASAGRSTLGLVIGTDVLAPNGNGSSLTALNASNLGSGTVPLARLSGITNTEISGSAAIAYSKLNLTGAILNTDLAGSIAYSKLSLTGAILNADLAGSIAYSKLSLTGAILNADLAGSIDLSTKVTGTLPVANGGTGITAFGTGIATFLGTPTSANLAAAITNETGSGALVFATSPTLVTPLLGTPTSGVLTNCTGLPPTTGITGWPANASGVLTNDGSGNLSWGAGGSGANAALSNLASVAVNTSLLPGTTNSIDLGSSSKTWANAYLTGNLKWGATSGEVMLKANGTSLSLRLADDSGYGNAIKSGSYEVYDGTNRVMYLYGPSAFVELALASTVPIGWSSSATAAGGSDTGLKRDIAKFIKPTDGSTGGGGLSLFPVSATPANPASSSEVHFYVKSGKLVVQYLDSAQIRYFTLDLTQSGATPAWAQSTSAP